MVVLPFLYGASQHRSIEYGFSPDRNTLLLRGVNIGAVANPSTNFAYQAPSVEDPDSCDSAIENQLRFMSTLITHDRWQDGDFEETSAARSQHHAQAQFAGFSAYVLPLLKQHDEDCFMSLAVGTWCEFCNEDFTPLKGETAIKPPDVYHCYICADGSYDICEFCYSQGSRCEVSCHVLKKVTVGTMSIPRSERVMNILEKHAPTGDGELFRTLISTTTRGAMFFSVSQRWRGAASCAIEHGDVIAILFGSRVPCILRRYGSAYRLVSTCYVQDFMDGEAIEMLEHGELQSEMFEIT